jgi:hypothetical protein
MATSSFSKGGRAGERSQDQAVTDMQRRRREQILEYNARVLAEIRKARGGT